MARAHSGSVVLNLRTLFLEGSLAALGDGKLLERFLSRRDEGGERAFALLVERHGPMVLGVCRRFLADRQDVDDAFQATFLVLIRRAGSVRVDESLGRWLYGVSVRVAGRARTRAAARRRFERRFGEEATARLVEEEPPGDLPAVLDEELGRLPEKYRSPIVLCHLEGLTQEHAARILGWPLGTVQGRLARARRLLRDRLTRRGLAPSAALLVMETGARPARAAVPDALVHAMVDAASRLAAGKVVIAPAAVLAEGVLRAMIATKVQVAATVLLVLGALGAGAGMSAAESRREGQARRIPAESPRESTPGVAPLLRVELSANRDRVVKGETIRFRIAVENRGDRPARQVTVRLRLSTGLRVDTGGGNEDPFAVDLRELAPGERIELDPVVARTTWAGEQTCTVNAIARDAGEGSAADQVFRVSVVEPKLKLSLDFPRQRYAEQIGNYSVTIENPGTAVAHNVQLVATLPPGLRLVGQHPNILYDPSTRTLLWPVTHLEPGAKETVRYPFQVRMGLPGGYQVRAQVRADGGLGDRVVGETNVIGMADIDLEIEEGRRVVDVNDSTTFIIRIKNVGSKEATQLLLRARHSDNLTVTQTSGTDAQAEYSSGKRGEFRFPPIERLGKGKSMALGIRVKALKAGQATCRVYLLHKEADEVLDDLAHITVTPAGQ